MIPSNPSTDIQIPSPSFYPFSHAILSFIADMNSEAYAVYLAARITSKSTQKYRKPYQLNRYFYQLAGLELDIVVVKWGEKLLLNVEYNLYHQATSVKKRFKLYDVAQEMLFKGQYENGLFPQAYFEEEKQSLQKEIELQMNNPIEWQFQLFMETMFANDPFRFSLLGSMEQVQQCSNHEIGRTYHHFVTHATLVPVLYGSFAPAEKEFFVSMAQHRSLSSTNRFDHIERRQVVTVEKEITYQQTWVFLGYRHDIGQNHRLYPALQLYHQIIGKLPASVLYSQLREKRGLCYYISSSLPFGKEVLFIIAGITYQDKAIFLEELNKAMQSILLLKKRQTFLALAKKRILSNMAGWQDYPMSRLNFELEIRISQAEYTFQSYKQAIEKVTWDEVAEVSKHIWLDTVYVCKGNHSR